MFFTPYPLHPEVVNSFYYTISTTMCLRVLVQKWNLLWLCSFSLFLYKKWRKEIGTYDLKKCYFLFQRVKWMCVFRWLVRIEKDHPTFNHGFLSFFIAIECGRKIERSLIIVCVNVLLSLFPYFYAIQKVCFFLLFFFFNDFVCLLPFN